MTLKGDAKFEEKLTCDLENNMRNMANFHQSTWKSQNYDFDEFFYPNRKHMTLKSTEALCVMTMKNDAKFEQELTCHFKIDIRNLNEFWFEHLKVSKIFILMCSFWAKYILFELKAYRGAIFHETEEG